MDRDTGLLLGKLLGEIYRLQRRTKPDCCQVRDAHIFALLNGFEDAIAEEIEGIGFISEQQVEVTCNVLNSIFEDQNKFNKFKGFYDIENDLANQGVGRHQARRILKYLYAKDQFVPLIDKMNSQDSPTECKVFKLGQGEI